MAPGAGLATAEHCIFCFDALVAHLSGAPDPQPNFDDGNCALFVTWNKASSSNPLAPPRLRGCIGTLEPRRLHTALKDYALTSALRDTRFSPIAARELPALSCGVSLLHAFEKGGDAFDWEVGTHGITIEFTDPRLKCRRSATFLPEVAPEQGWDREATLEALVKKAGYDGPVTDVLLSSIRLTRYQSSKARISHAEYAAAKAAAARRCRGEAAGEGVPAEAPGEVATVFA